MNEKRKKFNCYNGKKAKKKKEKKRASAPF